MKLNKKSSIGLVTILFLIWSAIFISRTSFVQKDGQRYFCLFDDAMISMRYAWNLSHGVGLVWNEGERVEGFTNMLMTLYMALAAAVFDKSMAVFFIQCSGIVFMLGIAFITMKIADDVISTSDPGSRDLLKVASFTAALGYYPLHYWSLMGMETGLLTLLLLAAVWVVIHFDGRLQITPVLPILMGLSFMTRPDAMVPVSLIMLYRIWGIVRQKGDKRIYLMEMAILAMFVVSLTTFRYIYYGEIVPNTYTLKISGVPLLPRIGKGIQFTRPFWESIWITAIVALFGVVTKFKRSKLLFISLFFANIAYMIFVGGDQWPYWRVVSPFIPLLFLLCLEGMGNLVRFLQETGVVNKIVSTGLPRFRLYLERTLVIGVMTVLLVLANAKFFPEMFFYELPYQVDNNRWNVNTAITINKFCGPNASLAVLWAGSIPYYTGLRSIDIFGKSDKYIASLPPLALDPGHSKYDFNYSVIKLKPTFVQYFSWGEQTILTYGRKHYKVVCFKGIGIWLLKDSQDVYWDKIEAMQRKPAS